MFVVTAQRHAFFENHNFAVNAGSFKSPFQGPGQYVFMKALAAEDLGRQHRGRPLPVALANLLHNGCAGLSAQPAAASRAVLDAQFAV